WPTTPVIRARLVMQRCAHARMAYTMDHHDGKLIPHVGTLCALHCAAGCWSSPCLPPVRDGNCHGSSLFPRPVPKESPGSTFITAACTTQSAISPLTRLNTVMRHGPAANRRGGTVETSSP